MARQAGLVELPLEWERPTTVIGRLAGRKLTHECVGGCGAISEPNSKRRHWSCAGCRKKAQAAGARQRRLRYESGRGFDKHARGLWQNHRCGHERPFTAWGSCPKCRRGLLCGDCNRLLGLAKDDSTTLTALADYLGRY